ncbi:hypothetical protein Mnod_3939 [Methylobacterium nodulans ORS 2060]|uniref:Uncharacterized protein n=1 Tax=Methylobacterium nodulans (strain LMG 21967 / CNCM I-2342 / ORS 2060) TaxID=460265 RepID=B8ISJ4_METNO|nr:hypothetical protein Mnod_3939 [Methylobacterium nodulans ORS 2060]
MLELEGPTVGAQTGRAADFRLRLFVLLKPGF